MAVATKTAATNKGNRKWLKVRRSYRKNLFKHVR